MTNGENYNKQRRTFLKVIAASLLVTPFLQFCSDKAKQLLIRLSGTNHLLGHRLWSKDFPKPTSQIQVKYLIVGGGISGLSAARQLAKKGIDDFLLLELEGKLGGNASNGENQFSKYPLGAHYLPLPNAHDEELLQFLEESKIITGHDAKGIPIFDEQQLTIAPNERLFYKNSWQEGVVPKNGNQASDDAEFHAFFSKMESYRRAKGADANYLFDIPLALSSLDEQTRALDNQTMKQWAVANGFTSQPLLDYIDYCCRDDFGLGIKYVSAWAGIHYFAGRKQDVSHNISDAVLTWPEGNARLAQHLRKHSEGKSLENHLVYDICIENDQVIAKVFNDQNKTSISIVADKVIMATPQFVNQYLIHSRRGKAKDFHYTPWLLATLTVSNLSDNGSFPLCWDNVIYGAKGLGYIYDQHQSLEQVQQKRVITYYHSFSSADLKKTRKEMYAKPQSYWEKLVFDDLRTAHPDIESCTEAIDIRLLGHGMISPVPGFLFGRAKKGAAQPIANKIFFAHSDLSGISIFEEAFHQGINAVNQIVDAATLDT